MVNDDAAIREHLRKPIQFTLRQLECFLGVAEHGSISAAAIALNASDSAVSDAVTAMERALGTVLFNRRRSRGASLTSDGLAIVPMVNRMLVNAEELAAAVGHGATALTGPVRIGAVDTLAPGVLPRLIDAAATRYPEVRIDYRTKDLPTLLTDLTNGDLDLVLTFDIEVPPELNRRRLYSTEATIVVHENHRLANRKSISLNEIADDPMILLDISSSRGHTMELMLSRSITPRIAYRTENYELCRSLVGRGVGYSLLMRRAIDSRTWDGGRVVFVSIDPPPRSVDILLVWLDESPAPRVSSIIDLAAQLMKSDAHH